MDDAELLAPFKSLDPTILLTRSGSRRAREPTAGSRRAKPGMLNEISVTRFEGDAIYGMGTQLNRVVSATGGELCGNNSDSQLLRHMNLIIERGIRHKGIITSPLKCSTWLSRQTHLDGNFAKDLPFVDSLFLHSGINLMLPRHRPPKTHPCSTCPDGHRKMKPIQKKEKKRNL